MALPKGLKYQIDLLANNKATASLNKFKRDVGGVNSAVAQLRNTIVAAFSGRELVEAANVMIGVKNRMDAFTGSAEETAKAMNHMKRIALESRSDFDAVAMLFTRLSLATEHLGATQDDVANATQMVANTFIIAGSHAQEANNSARQLAQGLASGALRGDELRSVMENNTILTKMLADGLNMTVGELREFGHAGKLTAEVVMPILIKGIDETNELIKEMPMTLGQAGVALRNNFQFMIGDIQESTGGFSKMANAVKFVAENLDALLIPAIMGVVSAVGLLTKAIIRNPLGFFVAGIQAAIMAAYIFRQEIFDDFREVFEVHIPNMVDIARVSFLEFKMMLNNLISAEALKNIKTMMNKLIGLVNSAIDRMPNISKRLGVEKIELFDIEAGMIDEQEVVDRINELKNNIATRVVSDKDVKVPSLMELLFPTEDAPESDKKTGFKQLSALETFFKDAEKGYKDFVTKIKTVQEEIQGVFKKSYDGLTNLTMDFLKNGKASFKDFATSIVEELLRIAVQKLVIDKMFAGFGALFPSLDISGKGKKALGGFVKGGNAYMVGESGRELFIPSENGQIVSNQDLKQTGTSSAPTVNFNISTVDAAGFDQLLASRKGLITQIINNAMNNQGKMGIV